MYSARDADLMAAKVPPFKGNRSAWIDAFANALGRQLKDSDPVSCHAAGERAYATQGEFHPWVIASLESWLGPYTPPA